MLLKAALIDVFLVIGFVRSLRVWNKDLRLRRGGAKLRITVEHSLITSLLSGCLFVCHQTAGRISRKLGGRIRNGAKRNLRRFSRGLDKGVDLATL